MARRATARAPGVAAVLFLSMPAAMACNAIFGIDEGHLVGAGAGGSSGSSEAGPAGGASNGGSQATSGGAGNAAAGGATSGGTGATGTGGSQSGAGGMTSASGGMAGTTADAGPETPGEIRCGDATCDIGKKQVCCVSNTSPFGAHCSTSCDTTIQIQFQCDGADDCSGTTPTCCKTVGQNTAACAKSCLGTVFCGKDADCLPGEYCTPGTGTFASVATCATIPKTNDVWCGDAACNVGAGNVCCYDKTTQSAECQKSCPQDTTHVPFACDGTEDCPDFSECCAGFTPFNVFTGNQCRKSNDAGTTCGTGGAIPCSGAIDCPTGQTCCKNGKGSVCAATCTGTALCATDADCPSGKCTLVTATTAGSATGTYECQ